jgi:EAL domain-containing protein (putative c-di-GMP-specific phosphodiesterase class I)
MSRQMLGILLGLAVFPLVAIAVAAYLLTTSGPFAAAIAGAILVLAACLVGLIVLTTLKASRQDEWLWAQHDRLRELADKTDALGHRLEAVELRSDEPARRLDEILADVKSLRDGVRTLLAAGQPARAAAPPARDWQPAAQRPVSAPPPPAPGAERLELSLQPVIELATGSTAHYRALLDLTDEQGHAVRHAELMHKADQGGMRPALDAHMVRVLAPVLRRLRLKNPSLRVFVPIGIATLSSPEDCGRIVASLERDVDVAGGMVFEFGHRELGMLDDSGIASLARLGRLGATLALSQVQVGGLDLAALRQLGVRYLSFPPHAGDAGFGPSAAWREFIQHARAMQFQVVVADIVTPQQATAAGKFGRFGYGAFFAPPRKVRADAGVAQSARAASAA